MATFAQASSGELEPALFALVPGGRILPSPELPTVQAYDAGASSGEGFGAFTAVDHKQAAGGGSYPGLEVEQSSGGFDWFEDFHVVPRAFDFGNLLSDQSTPIEVFSAFRHEVKEWTSFTNNAGAGVELGSSPALPTNVDPLSGFQMTLEVDAAGDPVVDSTLVFDFSGVGTITIPIEIQRIVLWGIAPELPFFEELEFVTNVARSTDGTEKRPSVRPIPRVSWSFEFLADEGTEAQILENLLFDYQARSFGVPGWFFDTFLSTAATSGDTSLAVEATAYRDFRVGGLVVVFTSQTVFDVAEITAIGSTSISLASPLVNSYALGSRVMPLFPSRIDGRVSQERYRTALQRLLLKFAPIDNQVDLADVSAFSSYKGLVLLDNGNSLRGASVPGSFVHEVIKLDGGAGDFFQDSPIDRSRRGHQFILRAEGRQAVWELRRLVYALRGRQVPFYVPRDSDDLTAVSDLLSASTSLSVANVGYAQFVRARAPKNEIRISFVDGSPPLLRTVTAAAVVNPTTDSLTVDSPWPSTITPAEISRIEYVEKVRLDSDKVRIDYDRSGNRARLVAPIVGLFE